MSFRAIYKCDICRDDMTKEQVVGVCFVDLTHFKLKGPESTQGIHICRRCLAQIYDQARGVLHPSSDPTSPEQT
jgi:hypothetical protein